LIQLLGFGLSDLILALLTVHGCFTGVVFNVYRAGNLWIASQHRIIPVYRFKLAAKLAMTKQGMSHSSEISIQKSSSLNLRAEEELHKC
jgi:hypothetical protein